MMTFRTDEPLGRAATATRLDAALMRCVTMLSVDQTMCKGDTRALTGTTRDRACGGGGGLLWEAWGWGRGSLPAPRRVTRRCCVPSTPSVSKPAWEPAPGTQARPFVLGTSKMGWGRRLEAELPEVAWNQRPVALPAEAPTFARSLIAQHAPEFLLCAGDWSTPGDTVRLPEGPSLRRTRPGGTDGRTCSTRPLGLGQGPLGAGQNRLWSRSEPSPPIRSS